MPEETTKHEGSSPINYPADDASGVSTPSDRLRRQMIKGGAGTVLAVAAVWAGWTKVLFPEGAAAQSGAGSSQASGGPGAPAGAPSARAGQKLGPASSFAEGAAPTLVNVGKENPQPYFVQNLGNGQFLALSAACTHKGCPVDWNPKDSLFVCPCHNGKFSKDGKNVSGPPPTPLATVPTRVENGDLVLA